MAKMLELSLEALILGFIGAMSIPSAITAFIMTRFNKRLDSKFDKQEARREQQQANFEKLILLTAQNIRTTYSVAKVAAESIKSMNPRATQSIDDAIGVADESQAKVQEFLIRQGVSNICE